MDRKKLQDIFVQKYQEILEWLWKNVKIDNKSPLPGEKAEKCKIRGKPRTLQQEKRRGKNEKEVVEVFVYMIPGKCEEKKWVNIKRV